MTMDILRRLLSTPKRLCDKARDREFERQLRQFQDQYESEQVRQFAAFQSQMAEKWREMYEALVEGKEKTID